MTVWDSIASAISVATHRPFTLRNHSSVGGGSINEAYRLEGTDSARYFLKLNDAQHLAMFVAEAQGLEAIADTNTWYLNIWSLVLAAMQGCWANSSLHFTDAKAHVSDSTMTTSLAPRHNRTAGKVIG